MSRGVNPLLRSALRFSHPLSGLLASSRFVALFHATAIPEVSSFRAFPSQRSRTPLEAASSLAVIPGLFGCTLRGLIRAGFWVRRPRKRARQTLPPAPMRFLSASRSCIPVPLDLSGRTHPPQPLHRLRSLPPFASPFTPAWVSPKPKADPLLAFLPL